MLCEQGWRNKSTGPGCSPPSWCPLNSLTTPGPIPLTEPHLLRAPGRQGPPSHITWAFSFSSLSNPMSYATFVPFLQMKTWRHRKVQAAELAEDRARIPTQRAPHHPAKPSYAQTSVLEWASALQPCLRSGFSGLGLMLKAVVSCQRVLPSRNLRFFQKALHSTLVAPWAHPTWLSAQ